MAYIDREKVKELIRNYGKGAIEDDIKVLDPVDDIILIAKAIDLIPTADVVEVVRCKDCVHYTIINGTCLLLSCKEQTVRVYEDDYCSNGLNKRKVNYCTDKQNKLRHCEDCHEIC